MEEFRQPGNNYADTMPNDLSTVTEYENIYFEQIKNIPIKGREVKEGGITRKNLVRTQQKKLIKTIQGMNSSLELIKEQKDKVRVLVLLRKDKRDYQSIIFTTVTNAISVFTAEHKKINKYLKELIGLNSSYFLYSYSEIASFVSHINENTSDRLDFYYSDDLMSVEKNREYISIFITTFLNETMALLRNVNLPYNDVCLITTNFVILIEKLFAYKLAIIEIEKGTSWKE